MSESSKVAVDLQSAGAPDISGMLHPASVAVLGASTDTSKPGARAVINLLKSKRSRRVYPIHTRHQELFGVRCYASLRELPETPDVVIVAIPADGVIQAMRDCAAAGVRNVIVFTAGFAETGGDGQADQVAIAAIARENGMNVLGPNCAGLFDINGRSAFCFSPHFVPDTWYPGNIALLIQGGGLGVALLEGQDRGVGYSWLVTLGNEAVLDCSDFIEAMIADENTRVIMLVLEGVKKGDAFRRAVRRAHAAGKYVIAMHQGRTEQGQRAAALHTGVLATSDLVNASVLNALGVPRLTDLDELYHLGALFSRYGAVQGKGICVVSFSGGAGTLAADLAAHYGVEMPQPQPETREAIQAILPSYASTANPMDLTTAVYRDPGMMAKTLALVAADPAYAAVVVPIPFYYPGLTDQLCAAVMQVITTTPKPIIVNWLSQGQEKPARLMLERGGVLVMDGTDLCMRVLSRYVAYAPDKAEAAVQQAPEPKALPASPEGILQEDVAKPLLAAYGIDVPAERLVHSRAEIAEAVTGLRFPLAMKVMSNDIVHKAAVGGVKLHLDSAQALEQAHGQMMAEVTRQCPQARIDGVLVQEMASGFELMLGAKLDRVWGPMVMVGAGGTLAEMINDVAVHTAPLDADAARQLFRGTRASEAMRKLGHGDDENVVQAIVAMSRFIFDHQDKVQTVDANPLLVNRDGTALLVDAVIQLRDATPGA